MSNFNTTLSASEQSQYKLDLLACGDMPQGYSGAHGAKLLVINDKITVHRKYRQFAEAIRDAEFAVNIAHRAIEHCQYDVSKHRASTFLHKEALEYLDSWVKRLDDAQKTLEQCRDEQRIHEQTWAELVF